MASFPSNNVQWMKKAEDMVYVNNTEIIKRCQNGDTDAFRELVVQYEQKVIWAAYQMLGNYEEAMDVCQEAFIRAYRALPRFNLTSNFYTWLYRIVVNLCIDCLRKHKNYNKPISFEEIGEIGSKLPPADQSLEQKELGEEVNKILQDMPEQYRIILILRDIEGFSCKEIEKILECNHNTVRWRLFRARQIFKEAWERHNKEKVDTF
jgi:RNA polymerase sigma-70 factor (ECF subfamily)